MTIIAAIILTIIALVGIAVFAFVIGHLWFAARESIETDKSKDDEYFK